MPADHSDSDDADFLKKPSQPSTTKSSSMRQVQKKAPRPCKAECDYQPKPVHIAEQTLSDSCKKRRQKTILSGHGYGVLVTMIMILLGTCSQQTKDAFCLLQKEFSWSVASVCTGTACEVSVTNAINEVVGRELFTHAFGCDNDATCFDFVQTIWGSHLWKKRDDRSILQ